MMIFDEEQLPNGHLISKYPYFDTQPEHNTTIGGYASEPKAPDNYFFRHTLTTLLQVLIHTWLYLTDFKE